MKHAHVLFGQCHPIIGFLPTLEWLRFVQPVDVHAGSHHERRHVRLIRVGQIENLIRAAEQSFELRLDNLELTTTDIDVQQSKKVTERRTEVQRARFGIPAVITGFDHRARPQFEQTRVLAVRQTVRATNEMHLKRTIALDNLVHLLAPIRQRYLSCDLGDERM